jgi:hypothetical protein
LADRWYSAIGGLNSAAVGLSDRPETTNDTVAIVSKITAGFKARLEYVLDQVCIETSDGGSDEMRRFVAERLIMAAQAGERSLEGLTEVGRLALVAFSGHFAAKTA